MNVKIKEINSHKYLEFEELKKYNINHAFVGKNGKITFKEICDDLDFNYNKFCRIKQMRAGNRPQITGSEQYAKNNQS